MKRLYLKFYATILAVLAVFVAVSALVWWLADDRNQTPQYLDVAAELTGALLPERDASPADQARAIEALNRKLRFDIALYDEIGDMIAMVGRPPPRFNPERARTGWRRGPGGPILTLQLPDGRWLVARQMRERPNPMVWVMAVLAAVALAVAVGAFPIVRGLAGRLERLKLGVEKLGGGDLAARIKVEGRDEVAALAESFNRSAQRIEELVAAHRLLLANASHELRTPLSRLALSAELLAKSADPRVRDGLRADVAELDQLVDEILLASRLDAGPPIDRRERVELLAIAAEEAARYGLEASGEPVSVMGDATLLRRLVRNLLENAQRYAGAARIDISVKRSGDRAVLDVTDRGPGVAPADREKIFEPFYRLAGAAESGRGFGLGLALVRRIAQAHGGAAVCLAAEGGGSRFRIDLPAV
jgi:signal transduction histidine kinase